MICKLCGLQYDYNETEAGNKAFCGRACQSKYRRVMGFDLINKCCVVCGEKFQVDKTRAKNRNTCSRSCGGHLAWEVGKGSRGEMKIKPKKCQYCETEFISKDKVVKYCSSACIAKARIDINKLKVKSIILTKCLICNKSHKNKKFCSNTCRLKYLGKNKKNHYWLKLNKLIKNS